MRMISFALATVSLAAAGTPANAAAILIDFDGVTNGKFINGFYNGGTDGAGASGPNLGVDFETGGWIADINFGTSPPNFGYPVFGVSHYVNVAAGFTGSIAFTYGAFNSDTIIRVFDGLNGTGTVLGSIGAPVNDILAFTPLSLSFSGMGRSISVSGSVQTFGWDDLRIGGTAVPEPATWAMMLGGFGLAGGAMRYRRRAVRVSFSA